MMWGTNIDVLVKKIVVFPTFHVQTQCLIELRGQLTVQLCLLHEAMSTFLPTCYPCSKVQVPLADSGVDSSEWEFEGLALG